MRGKDAETMENMIVDQMNAIIDLAVPGPL